jgi:hypothetical protein
VGDGALRSSRSTRLVGGEAEPEDEKPELSAGDLQVDMSVCAHLVSPAYRIAQE